MSRQVLRRTLGATAVAVAIAIGLGAVALSAQRASAAGGGAEDGRRIHEEDRGTDARQADSDRAGRSHAAAGRSQGALAAEGPWIHPGRRREADLQRRRLQIPGSARLGVAARNLLVHRQDGGRPRHARLRRRRRGHHQGPREVQEDHRRPHRSAQDAGDRRQTAHRDGQAHLLGDRQHPLRRDGQRRDADGARLSPRDRGVAVHPADPQQHHLRLHAHDRGGRTRPAGGQPASRSRQPAGAVDGLLGQVRRARQQPRRHRQGPEVLAERAGRVPRHAPHRAARPARIREPPLRLDRHRPVQPHRRSDPGQ